MAANRVVVLLSDEELSQVQAKAGLVPLSAWFRALALGAKKPNKQAVHIEKLRALDPNAHNRPDVEYGSDELPSGGSVGVPLPPTPTPGQVPMSDVIGGHGKTSIRNWRAGRKPILKPGEKK